VKGLVMAEDNHAVIMLRARFADSIISARKFRGEVTVTVRKEDIIGICGFLKENLRYNLLTDVTAVDYLGKSPRFMMVYHLYSIPDKQRLRLKAPIAESDLTIDSLVPLWKGANWLEREVFDLFGITFNNHPDLRRILMPNDWTGHPLRKDYPLQGPDREPYKGRLS
jgi:NADH-quinone oxidoreductase subunit C